MSTTERGTHSGADREQELASQKAREAAQHKEAELRKRGQATGQQVEKGMENVKQMAQEKAHEAQEYAHRVGEDVQRQGNYLMRKLRVCFNDLRRTPTWIKAFLTSSGFLLGFLSFLMLGSLGYVTYKGSLSLFGRDNVSYEAHKSLDTILNQVQASRYGGGQGMMDYMKGGGMGGYQVQQPWWATFVPGFMLPARYQSYGQRAQGMAGDLYNKLHDMSMTKSYKDSMFSGRTDTPSYMSRSLTASEDFLAELLHSIGDASHRAGDKVHS